jgi:hypothetical protein
VALAAAFLAGFRYGEYRATVRRGGVVRAMVISTPETAQFKVQVHRGE